MSASPVSPWVIGVDIGGTKIAVGRVSARGEVRERRQIATPTGGPDAVVAAIAEQVSELRDVRNDSPLGIGVGAAGQIEAGTGTVRFSPNLDWHEVPLARSLSEVTGLSTVVINDVRAAAWGEWLFGAGRGHQDLMCVFVGTGIGGGIVSGGRMVNGTSNSAGEIGHLTSVPRGRACTCGGRGCLEAYAGGWALARDAQAAVAADPAAGRLLVELAGGDVQRINAATVSAAYRSHDPLSRSLVYGLAEALAAGLCGLVNVLNPSRIIMGGSIVEGLPEILKWTTSRLASHALPEAGRAVEIVAADLRQDAAIVGAAALVMTAIA